MNVRKPRSSVGIAALLSQFEVQEREFVTHEFLAPALPGGAVRVRIGGAICVMRIQPVDFHGWGVFQPKSLTEALLAREATLAERRSYLKLLPLIRLIVCRRVEQIWYGSAASFGDRRIQMAGLAPVGLTQDVQLFDCIRARYDGSRFWFEELDMRADPAAAAFLRESLNEGREPSALQRRGLSAEQRAAYDVSYWEIACAAKVREERQRRRRTRRAIRSSRADQRVDSNRYESDSVRRRLQESLSHAGARLVDYLERSDSFRVTFRVGNRSFTSSVDKDDLTVQVAGICLSGEDQKFDLSSLVGVLHQGSHAGMIVQVGQEDGGIEE